MKKHCFILFFIGIILCTYLGCCEEFILVLAAVCSIRMRPKIRIHRNMRVMYIFVAYFGVVSFLGALFGFLQPKFAVQYIITIILLPFIISKLLSLDKSIAITAITDFKNFVLFAACYGFIESILKTNVISKIILIDAADWINNMNQTVFAYQPSSLFLHYTYYASILLVGVALTLFYPYKSKMLTIGSLVLFTEQIFAAQSRICWIAYLVLIISYLLITEIITLKKVNAKYLIVVIISIAVLFVAVLLNSEWITRIYNSIVGRFSSLFVYGMQEGSLGQRLGTAMNWPSYFLKRPLLAIFGAGFGSSINVFLKDYSYFAGYTTADCQYITLLIEAGIIGTVLCIAAILEYWSNFRKKTTLGRMFRVLFWVYLVECITYEITTYFVIFPLYFVGILNYRYNPKAKELRKTVKGISDI